MNFRLVHGTWINNKITTANTTATIKHAHGLPPRNGGLLGERFAFLASGSVI
jgi:hypothetical protein